MNIKINKIHILFIFKDSINSKVTSFCFEFGIPYIYYDYASKTFVDFNFKDINFNDLLIRTSYELNNSKWKSALEYEQKNIKIKKQSGEQNIENSSDSESSDVYYEQSQLNASDIVINQNFSL